MIGAHDLLSLASIKGHRSFKKALEDPVAAQGKVLESLIQKGIISSSAELKNAPLTEYKDYKSDIDRARGGSKSSPFAHCSRFEPTSGSTEHLKWIPYTSQFKSELDRAAGPWLRDLYLRYPAIKKGPHYWSLSWLPDDLRQEVNNEDTNALPWYKSILLKNLMVTDSSFEKLPTSRLFMMTSLARIIARKASLVSVWSPTFFLRLLDLLLEEKKWLVEELQDHPEFVSLIKSMDSLEPELLQKIFPNLSLISAWDSSTSSEWAQRLKNYFPSVAFQGKGLWATEGVFTFPFENRHPLAVCSHFYEFWFEPGNRIIQLEELELGMVVQPVLTSGNGFVRYHLKDNVEVSEFYGKTPCFRFLGRSRHVDLAGEKISYEEADAILGDIKLKFSGVIPVCLIAHESKGLRTYKALIESSEMTLNSNLLESLTQALEEGLLENYHYKLARDLGQLERAQIYLQDNALDFYYEACGQRISGEGNIKPEPLIHLKE